MSIFLKRFAAFSFSLLFYLISLAQFKTEKVYLHFDKPYYVIGDNCWYKAYVVDEDLKPTTTSGILYVDFIDPAGNIIRHQQLKIYSGEAFGDFSFHRALSPGNYLVRAYTNYMRNDEPDFFFYKSIFVYGDSLPGTSDTSRKIDLQFFPEGGIAVNHLPTQVAFKAIDATGKGVEITGNIIDEKNNHISILKSSYRGLGMFPYLPTADKKYRVVLNTGEEYNLPEASNSGVVMNVNNMHPDKIFVRIQSTVNDRLKLTGISRGRLVFSKTFETVKDQANIEIPKKDLPGGIFQLTVYDGSGVPKAERIVFIDKNEKVNIRIISANKKISPRDSVAFTIKTTNENGRPLETSLSVAITDAGYVEKDSSDANILTQLLLQSDLIGYIDNPAWFLQPENKYALDLVMLTNGWRKYEMDKTPQYKPELGLALKGKVISKANNQPVPHADISLMIADLDYNGIFNTISDAEGNFRIDSVDFGDSTNLIWQVINDRGKLTEANIVLTDSSDIPVVDRKPFDKTTRPEYFSNIQYSDTSKIGLLDTVEVIRRKRTYRTVGVGGMLVKPDKNDLNTMATTFLSKYALALPHLKPIACGANGEVCWITPGGGGVKMIINGYVYDDKTPSGNPFYVLNSYRTDELEYAVVNGNNRDGYVIILQTKIEPNKPTPGIFKQNAPGYQYVRSFYHPKYGPANYSPGPDHRTTLYWDPYIVTDANGEAVISFYNSDVAKKFLIVVEGMSNGLILSDMKTIGGD